MFDAKKEALNEVAMLVLTLVERTLLYPIGARWDDGGSANLLNVHDQGVGIFGELGKHRMPDAFFRSSATSVMTHKATNNYQQVSSLVFVDGSLADLQAIQAGLDPSLTAIVLDPTQDGIQQMADVLAGMIGLNTIHIISHGSSGQINLGTTQLTLDTLDQYQNQLATIYQALSATGDLLLYGCNVAQGSQGQAFISALASATGADVAASTDLTGNTLLGGNWTLEAATGAIQANTLNANISGVLAVIDGTTGNDTLTGTVNDDQIYGNGGDDTLDGDTGNDTLHGGDGNDYLNSSIPQGIAGNDTLFGDAGNDTLFIGGSTSATNENVLVDGGVGDDLIQTSLSQEAGNRTLMATGGSGIDTYQIMSGQYTASYTVTDFTAGAGGDRIDVSALRNYSAGIDIMGNALGYLSGNPFSVSNGYLRLVQSGADTLLQYDEDGAARTAYTFHTTMVLQGVAATALTSDNFVGGINPNGSGSGVVDTTAPEVIDMSIVGSNTVVFEYSENVTFNPNAVEVSGGGMFLNGTGADIVNGWSLAGNLFTATTSVSIAPTDWLLLISSSAFADASGNTTIAGLTTAFGGTGDNIIDMSAYTADVLIIGHDGNDTLTGGAGDDGLGGGQGSDILDGGAGNDIAGYWRGPAGVTVSLALTTQQHTGGVGGGGARDLDTLINIEGLEGSDFGDALTGNALDNSLYGKGGSDTLNGGDGNDLLSGDQGNDSLDGGAGSDTAAYSGSRSNFTITQYGIHYIINDIAGANGTDTLTNIESLQFSDMTIALVEGSAGNDSLSGGAGSDALTGGDGDDILTGGAGDDILTGGAGTDTFNVDAGTDTLADAVPGTDVINISSGATAVQSLTVASASYATNTTNSGTLVVNALPSMASTITGSSGIDSITGSSADDSLDGGSGNDILNGSTGNDVMEGGTGNDTYYVDSTGDSAVETGNVSGSITLGFRLALDLSGNIDKVIASISYTLGNYLENLDLAAGSGNLTGTGNALDNTLAGNEGNNTLTGGAGNDTLDGGAGVDIASYTGNRANFTVTQSGTGFTVTDNTGANGTDTLANVERLSFADGYLGLDTSGTSGQMYRLYKAAFNRVPDPPGLGWNIHLVDGGLTLAQMSAAFVASAEFTSTYGALSNTQFLDQLYLNVLNRLADPVGAAWNLNLLDTNAVDRPGMLAAYSESAENQAAVIGQIQDGIWFT